MTTLCTVCSAPTSAYLCRDDTTKLETALADLPALVDHLVTATVRQTRVYRSTGRRREPDQDWRGATHALPPHAMPVDLDASVLLRAAGNTLTTWARHLAETRDVPLALSIGQATEGPVCAGHQHDERVIGCQDQPSGCRHLHPDHQHTTSRPGCPDDCAELHCTHRSCETIRRGEFTGTAAALVRWFLRHANTIRYDEAAGVMHREITALHAEIARAVDRTPSPFFAGPCHATITEPITSERDGTVYIEVVTHRCERDLYAWPGRDAIVCDGTRATKLTDKGYRVADLDDTGCGTEHTPTSRREWLVAAVDDALVSIDEMAIALPSLFRTYPQPPKTVMQAWVRQGRLIAKGLNHAAQETYRGGDLLGLVVAYRPHKYAPRQRRDGRLSA